jgi:hypothetical protein
LQDSLSSFGLGVTAVVLWICLGTYLLLFSQSQFSREGGISLPPANALLSVFYQGRHNHPGSGPEVGTSFPLYLKHSSPLKTQNVANEQVSVLPHPQGHDIEPLAVGSMDNPSSSANEVVPWSMRKPAYSRISIRLPRHLEFEKFVYLVRKYAEKYGVDAKLILALIRQESGFNPSAVSPKGAMGLMQLMPGTAELMGVTSPFDMEQNIAGGVKYLKLCLLQFNQDIVLALAAYNAGPINVIKYQGCPPFAETRGYVAAVLGNYHGRLDFKGPKMGKIAANSGTASRGKESGLEWRAPTPKWKVAGPQFKVQAPRWKVKKPSEARSFPFDKRQKGA